MKHAPLAWLVLLTLLSPCFAQADGAWADLKGRVVIRFKQPPALPPIPAGPNRKIPDESLLVGLDGGLANVVVYVLTPEVAVHADLAKQLPANVVMTFNNSRAEPRIAPVWTQRQAVEFRNREAFSYNLNATPVADTPFNVLLIAGDTIWYTPQRPQSKPVQVACTIQPWLKGYLVPRDNPYVAVTRSTGNFTIGKLPARSLEFQLWHERFGYLDTPAHPQGRLTFSLKPGENDLGTIVVER